MLLIVNNLFPQKLKKMHDFKEKMDLREILLMNLMLLRRIHNEFL